MNLATREAFGKTLVELIKNEDVVVLDADLAHATKTMMFAKECPERFFNAGIAEADMIGTAAGLALSGKIPFASTFAVFATGRAFDQIRNSVCYPNANVKIVGTHAGISVGEDGGTHQTIEDIALMRSLPNMTVIHPCDDVEARQAVLAAAEYDGPVYLRMSRVPTPTLHSDEYKFEIGKGETIREGKDVAIVATGLMVAKAKEAAEKLAQEGIDAKVINISTIKPLDANLLLSTAKEVKGFVTVEEHNVHGGLGSAVSELLSQNEPKKIKMVGVQDKFGKSGNPDKLFEMYGLTVANIVEAAKSL
ncbi:MULTISPECIES: transketolase family protein [unclassified Enterococcus]|uniref:transketolase family protein n=1 Tax=unclassified Enterococcus TaxID=2608891 RepID=UPI003F21D83A